MAMLLVSSCVDNPDDTNVSNGGFRKISFSANIKGATRATELQFENGDAISIFGSTTNSIEEYNYAQNIRYEYADTKFDSNYNLWYPNPMEDLTFYAVYPYGEYTTPGFTFAVNTDQREHSNYTKSDLMTASAPGNNSKVVDLTFTHRLSKVVINISSSNMPAGEQSIIFKNVKSYASVDLKSNTFSSIEGSRADIIGSSNGTNSFKVILPPQTITAGSEFVEIVIGNRVFSWVVDRDLIFNSGVEYSYDLEIKDNVLFTAQINPWGTPEDIESVIPEEYLEILEPYIPIYPGVNPPNVEGTYLISPCILVTDNVGFEPGYKFADEYIQFYGQTSDNRINSRSTQLLGDLSVGEGLFISGEGNNFSIYFNEYETKDDGSWFVKATIISGTMSNGTIQNYTYAFIVLDDYDTVDRYMDAGEYRVICDGDYVSPTTTWPLDDTRAVKRGTGVSIYVNKK